MCELHLSVEASIKSCIMPCASIHLNVNQTTIIASTAHKEHKQWYASLREQPWNQVQICTVSGQWPISQSARDYDFNCAFCSPLCIWRMHFIRSSARARFAVIGNHGFAIKPTGDFPLSKVDRCWDLGQAILLLHCRGGGCWFTTPAPSI